MRYLAILIAASLLSLPSAAEARDFRPGAGPRVQAQDQPGKRGNGQRSERKQRADPEQRKPGRLSQEERRELHRDLDRANREIYRR